jgi:hypothetical protein
MRVVGLHFIGPNAGEVVQVPLVFETFRLVKH